MIGPRPRSHVTNWTAALRPSAACQHIKHADEWARSHSPDSVATLQAAVRLYKQSARFYKHRGGQPCLSPGTEPVPATRTLTGSPAFPHG